MKKILIVGAINNTNLESSYVRAAKKSGNYDVKTFDYNAVLDKYILFGKIGRKISSYIDIQAWLHKMNREFVILAKEYEPDIILLFCNVKVSPASILFLKSILKNTKIVLVWPDSLNNMQSNIFQMAGLIDLLATYSSNSIPYFEKVGFKNVSWVPLAGDIELNYKPIEEAGEMRHDISFVGNWRIERENTLVEIINNFKDKKIGVFGPSWKRYATNNELKRICENRSVYGMEMTNIFQQSRINLNKIDDTNLPSANMRFFEIPIAGGLMLSSPCPEMEEIYIENESVFYFKNDIDLLEKVDSVLKADTLSIRRHAQEITMNNHNYSNRLDLIVSLTDNI